MSLADSLSDPSPKPTSLTFPSHHLQQAQLGRYASRWIRLHDHFGWYVTQATAERRKRAHARRSPSTGSATHNGGSCQFSISYDQGKTFAVLASIIGGCPIGSQFTIPIPDDLPSASKATFAWTWSNYSGNREMYMNCAIVDVSGSDTTSYTGPSLFRSNTFADGSCISPEGAEVSFSISLHNRLHF